MINSNGVHVFKLYRKHQGIFWRVKNPVCYTDGKLSTACSKDTSPPSWFDVYTDLELINKELCGEHISEVMVEAEDVLEVFGRS